MIAAQRELASARQPQTGSKVSEAVMGSSFAWRMWGRSCRGAGAVGRSLPVGGILLVVPGLLFLPVLYYTLTTPFALIDDYAMAKVLMGILDSREEFFRWLTDLTYRDGEYRHRPFWEFYNAATWHVLGPLPWLHHLARWVIHFGAVLAFGAALLTFAPKREGGDGAGSREPGAGSREPGAGSREPGAGSREPGAGSREPGASGVGCRWLRWGISGYFTRTSRRRDWGRRKFIRFCFLACVPGCWRC